MSTKQFHKSQGLQERVKVFKWDEGYARTHQSILVRHLGKYRHFVKKGAEAFGLTEYFYFVGVQNHQVVH